jgi:ribonuclease BN (tRNA processing enzyme)
VKPVPNDETALSITVLGCSGTYSAAHNACSGYLIRRGDTNLLVDTDPGTLAHLQEHVALNDLSAIVISHSHPDHWSELGVLRNAFRYGIGRSGVPVYTVPEVHDLCEVITPGTEPTFVWHRVSDGERRQIFGVEVMFSRTDHPVETLAMRFADPSTGRAIVYSADSGPGWSLEAFGSPIDLALCEATLRVQEEGKAPHMSGRQAGDSARAAGAARLVITHLMPGADVDEHRADAARAFGHDVEVAEVGRRFWA